MQQNATTQITTSGAPIEGEETVNNNMEHRRQRRLKGIAVVLVAASIFLFGGNTDRSRNLRRDLKQRQAIDLHQYNNNKRTPYLSNDNDEDSQHHLFLQRLLQKSTTTNSRIVGGSNAAPNRYPYYTFVEYDSPSRGFVQCGGSLIRKDIVLTVAHCDPGDAVSISLGVNFTSTTDTSGFHFRTTQEVIPHPNYNPTNKANDVAIIKLNSPVENAELMDYNGSEELPVDGSDVVAIGFGSTSVNGPYPSELQEVTIQVVDIDTCNSEHSYTGTIQDDIMICAGSATGGRVRTCEKESLDSIYSKIFCSLTSSLFSFFVLSGYLLWRFGWSTDKSPRWQGRSSRHHFVWSRLWDCSISWDLHTCEHLF